LPLVGESSTILGAPTIGLFFSGVVLGDGSLDCEGLGPHGLFVGGKRPGDFGPNGPDNSVDESSLCKNGLAGTFGTGKRFCVGDIEFNRSDIVGGLGVLEGFL